MIHKRNILASVPGVVETMLEDATWPLAGSDGHITLSTAVEDGYKASGWVYRAIDIASKLGSSHSAHCR